MEYQQRSGRLDFVHRSRDLPRPQVLASPHEDVLLSFLSRLAAQAFPEFVKDLLTLTEGHTLVAVTDGPGDEQQDLLTISPDGKRCLIQCKHFSNSDQKCRGNDLDLLLAACLRKNCTSALLITNGQLTTQAKRYILDKEYTRGWPEDATPLAIDYRDGYRIWEQVSTNNVILNKWFSGLGQTHGLRAFRFELSIHSMPFVQEQKHDVLESPLLDKILDKLLDASLIRLSDTPYCYEGRLNDAVSFRISRSFQLSNDLDINYCNPDTDPNYVDKPLPSLVFEITVSTPGTFNPGHIRQQLITFLIKDNLPPLAAGSWWLLLAGRGTSFVYLHDISEARQLALLSAETFVLTDKNIDPELSHIQLDPDEFEPDSEEDSSLHRHRSGCLVRQLFAQETEPYDEFNESGVRNKQQQVLQDYTFKCVECPDNNVAARIRNILPDTWFVFQRGNELIWCYDTDAKPETINYMDEMVNGFGLLVKKMTAAQRKKLLRHIRLNKPKFIFHDQLKQLRFPVDLIHRLFWIAKPLPVGKKAELSIISGLFRFKRAYEQQWCKAEPLNYAGMSYRDLTYLLFQPNDIRGQRMLDINIWDDPFWIVMRFIPNDTAPSNELTMIFLEEFNQVFNQIEKLTSKHTLDDTAGNNTI